MNVNCSHKKTTEIAREIETETHKDGSTREVTVLHLQCLICYQHFCRTIFPEAG